MPMPLCIATSSKKFLLKTNLKKKKIIQVSGKPHPTKPLSHIFESKSTPNRKENKSYWCIRQNKSHVIQNQSSSLLLAH